MSNSLNIARLLRHLRGVAGPARVLAFQGISASAVTLASLALIPASASAYATLEGPPTFSNTSVLPDGRFYEQVVPTSELNGNEAGASTTSNDSGALNHYGLASPEGNSIAFEGTGPIGESPWGASELFVATRHNEGAARWSTRAVLPRTQQPITEVGGIIGVIPKSLVFSPDLSHILAVGQKGTLAPQLNESCYGQLYLAGPEPFVAATWLEQPELDSGESAVEDCGLNAGNPAGGTPNFSTVYFSYPGTLLPADHERAPHAGTGPSVEAWGFYEDHEGSLREAGVLPDEKLDPFGAVPAASGHGRSIVGNQVSAEGTRAFFVSPDPASCKENGGQNECATDPPELYVRVNGERTLLVSQDTLPGAFGDPAPTGVQKMPNPANQVNAEAAFDGSYVFASPDGSQAFFQSGDDLTQAAAEASPGSEPKTYDFDVNTGTVTYLPGVAGEIVATDSNGSALAFVHPQGGGASAELDLWSGSGAGSVTPITQLPGAPSSGGGSSVDAHTPIEYVSDAEMSSNGSVLVFVTATGLSSSFNSDGQEEVYRYDDATNTLGCVSCAPAGATPRGPASISALRASETYENREHVAPIGQERGISSDGSRIFFDSPDPLVKRDANTDSPEVPYKEETLRPQGRDVYEWENGSVYLISTGKSTRDSFLLDSSENGDNVFFATAEAGLVPGDTDGGYNVYDARVPSPGEGTTTAGSPCEGSVCQGPAGVPSPLLPPTSASFSGSGNPVPEVAPPTIKRVVPLAKCPNGKARKKGSRTCTKAKRKPKPKRKARKASRTSRRSA
jgi:hypothetical protein